MQAAAAAVLAPFAWVDGPLITAMKQGHAILLDEINLAEDAVLERLNRSTVISIACMTLPIQPYEVVKLAHGPLMHAYAPNSLWTLKLERSA